MNVGWETTNNRERHLKTKAFYRKQLPPVGFRKLFQPDESEVLEVPTWGEVIFVNRNAMWYTVRYHGSKMKETFSLLLAPAYTTGQKQPDIKKKKKRKK